MRVARPAIVASSPGALPCAGSVLTSSVGGKSSAAGCVQLRDKGCRHSGPARPPTLPVTATVEADTLAMRVGVAAHNVVATTFGLNSTHDAASNGMGDRTLRKMPEWARFSRLNGSQ